MAARRVILGLPEEKGYLAIARRKELSDGRQKRRVTRVVFNGYGVGKNFSFCYSYFRFLQLEEAHSNEINHDIYLANTMF